MDTPAFCRTSNPEFKHGLRVRVVSPAPEPAHTKGWTGLLGEPSRGPRVRGERRSGAWGDWWHVHFTGGRSLFRRDELELI